MREFWRKLARLITLFGEHSPLCVAGIHCFATCEQQPHTRNTQQHNDPGVDPTQLARRLDFLTLSHCFDTHLQMAGGDDRSVGGGIHSRLFTSYLPRPAPNTGRPQPTVPTMLCLPKTSSPDYVHWALLRISRRPASITGHADRLSRTVHRVGLRPAEPGGAPD